MISSFLKLTNSQLLENQMERENIVLLQTLLHFREHGLLDLDRRDITIP